MRRVLPGLLLIVAALGFGVWALPSLPERVATHWGLEGEPNGWSSRGVLVFLLPAFGFVLAGVLSILPRIDPRRASYELHGGTYWAIANVVLGFFALLHIAVVGFNLGWRVPMDRLLGLSVGALFVLIGNLMTRIRPNWFMGIRTPWTLSSDLVWRKTHRVGGYAFVAAGLLGILAALFIPRWSPFVVVGGAVASAVVSVVYSFLVWRATTPPPAPRP